MLLNWWHQLDAYWWNDACTRSSSLELSLTHLNMSKIYWILKSHSNFKLTTRYRTVEYAAINIVLRCLSRWHEVCFVDRMTQTAVYGWFHKKFIAPLCKSYGWFIRILCHLWHWTQRTFYHNLSDRSRFHNKWPSLRNLFRTNSIRRTVHLMFWLFILNGQIHCCRHFLTISPPHTHASWRPKILRSTSDHCIMTVVYVPFRHNIMLASVWFYGNVQFAIKLVVFSARSVAKQNFMQTKYAFHTLLTPIRCGFLRYNFACECQ